MADLHYTRDEVERLRDEATPGPWRWDDGRGKSGCDEGEILAADSSVLWLGDSEPYENSCGCCNRPGDRAMLAASWSLAADLLTLHDERDRLLAWAERVRGVLLGLADGCGFEDTWEVVIDMDNALVDCDLLDDDDRTWSNTARALRALAEVPRG